jgi:hypothetical protein
MLFLSELFGCKLLLHLRWKYSCLMEYMNKHAGNLAKPKQSCYAVKVGFIYMFLLLMSCRSAFKMSWQLQNHCIHIGLFNTMIEMEVCRKIVVFKLWSSCFQYQGQDELAILLYSNSKVPIWSWQRWISSCINNISKLLTIFIKCLNKKKCSPWHKSVLCNPCSAKKNRNRTEVRWKNQEPDGWTEVGECGAHTRKKSDGAGDVGLAQKKTE